VVMLLALSGLLISPAGRGYVQGILNNPEVQQLLGQTSVSALVMESLRRRAVNPWTFLFLGGLVGWALALFAGNGVIIPPAVQADTMASNEPVSPALTEALAETPALSTRPNPASRTLPPPLPAALLERFVLILLIVGLGLPLAVEFVYLRDNFGIRMNTIFKFYFQAWVLLALASAFAVYFVGRHLRGVPAVLWQVSMVLLVAGGMVYPVLAIPNKADYFRSEPTLNGIRWVSEQVPGDYAAIEWLRENAPDGAVVLEAPGKSYAAYQYTGRVSALTGIPTLLGWGGHESQWRGNYDEPARREPDIDTLFNTVDLQQTQMLLDKYHIMYVYIGPLERERYSSPGLDKFSRLMDVAFQSDNVTIYKRR
jgi:YYY domain-containing protein